MRWNTPKDFESLNTLKNKAVCMLRKSFFDEEIRCDYLVTKKVKKTWAIELELAKVFLDVCEKHSIKVSAFGGTLLGAIRHNGFIPWDDDMDFCMDRTNYEKFLSVASEEFKHPYFLQNCFTDRQFFFGYCRLRNSETTGLITYNCSKDYNNGIYIDIFVLDGYLENEKKVKKQIRSRNIRSSILAQYYQKKKQSIIKRAISSFFRNTYCKLVSYEKNVEKYNSVLSKFTNKTNRLSLMTHSFNFYSKYWVSKSDFDHIIQHKFENITIPIFENYDCILKRTYGNYLDFPPILERGKWHDGTLTIDPDIPYKEYIEKHFE